jgi:ribosomal protein S1
MKNAGALLVLAAITVAMVLAPVAWAEDVQGKIKSVDASGKMVTLDDGTRLMIPPTLTVEKQALKPGATVKASYEEKDGQKVATSFMVMPAR